MAKKKLSEKFKKPKGLNTKQKLFCDEYMIDLHGPNAAVRAGYSKLSVQDLLVNPYVRACLDEKIAERSKRVGLSADRVLQEIARLALVNPKNVIDTKTGRIREDASDDEMACVQSIKVKHTYGEYESDETEVRLHDKNKSLEMAMRHLGIGNQKVEHTGPGAKGEHTFIVQWANNATTE
jgi:phage terminase small subunit